MLSPPCHGGVSYKHIRICLYAVCTGYQRCGKLLSFGIFISRECSITVLGICYALFYEMEIERQENEGYDFRNEKTNHKKYTAL